MRQSLERLLAGRGANGRSPLVELFFFGLVGGSGVVAFILLSNGLIALRTGLPDWVASALCYASLILPVYLLHKRFSFQSDAGHAQALPRYIAVQLSALTLATGLSYLFYAVFGTKPLFASILVAGLTSAVNFFVLKLWAFASGAGSAPALAQD